MSGSEIKADLWLSEYLTPWDIYLRGITKVFVHKKTRFQEIYIVEIGGYGKALVLDGDWQSCVNDEFLYHEPLVHAAMIQHGAPRKVLVLGGGEGATIREALRWHSVEKVVMIDIDGEVVEACREHLPEMHANAFDDPRLELVIGDALEFVDATDEKWDVIIQDLTEPIEEGPSFQLFTKEHFEKVRKILAPRGFFVMQAGSLSPERMKSHARINKTLKAVFPKVYSYQSFVPTYGTPWGFVLASDEEINVYPEPETVDKLLAEKTSGGLRMLDGIALLGIFQLPKHLREAIATETKVYTLAEPPRF